jgi:hypothetical protein
MFAVGVTLVALAVLFGLTALALRVNDQLRRPYLVVAVLTVTLGAGLALIAA